MNKDREYQNYVNTEDKLLKEIDEIRLKLSKKLRQKTAQDQLVYFRHGLVRDKGKTEYRVK